LLNLSDGIGSRSFDFRAGGGKEQYPYGQYIWGRPSFQYSFLSYLNKTTKSKYKPVIIETILPALRESRLEFEDARLEGFF
jgi:hypothetical protein